MCARSTCLLGLGDRGHPRVPASSVAGPYEQPPSPLAPWPALHRVASRCGAWRPRVGEGSQVADTPRWFSTSGVLARGLTLFRKNIKPPLSGKGIAREFQSAVDLARGEFAKEIIHYVLEISRGTSSILSTAVFRPRRFSGWVEDLARRIYTWKKRERERKEERRRETRRARERRKS